MKKSIIAIGLAVCSLFCFTGCGQETEPPVTELPPVPQLPETIRMPELKEPILLMGDNRTDHYAGELYYNNIMQEYVYGHGTYVWGGLENYLLSPTELGEDTTVTVHSKADLKGFVAPYSKWGGEVRLEQKIPYTLFQTYNGMDWELLYRYYESDPEKYETYNGQLRSAWEASEETTVYLYELWIVPVNGIEEWRSTIQEDEVITDITLHTSEGDYALKTEIHLYARALPGDYHWLVGEDPAYWMGWSIYGMSEVYTPDGVTLAMGDLEYAIIVKKDVILKRVYVAEEGDSLTDISFSVNDGVLRYELKWDGTPLSVSGGTVLQVAAKWHTKPGMTMKTFMIEYEYEGQTYTSGVSVHRDVRRAEEFETSMMEWIAVAEGLDPDRYYIDFVAPRNELDTQRYLDSLGK
ncbi:MAG: hypothetical protein ACI4U2_06565 [Christensenellaceae bacterium]